MGEGVIGVVGERRKMMRIGNIGASMRYLRSVRARMEAAGEVGPGETPAAMPGLPDAQSQLALPLTVKDRLVGVLVVESRASNAFDELDEVLLRIVGNQAATAIDNARTYRMVDQLGRLKRFFSPQLAELIIRGGADDPLKTHRREITVVFLDLRGFTAFAETSEPEELMGVLREYHAEMGKLILAHEGTLERFTGDGMMIFFNDPLPVPDAAERAVRMAVAMRERAAELAVRWHRQRLRARPRHRHRQGVRHHRRHRLRGAPGLWRDRHRHEPGGAPLRRGQARPDPDLAPAAPGGGRGSWRSRRWASWP